MGDIRHGARHQVSSGSSKRCFSLLEKNMKGKCIGKAIPGLQKGQVALGLRDLSWGLTVGVSTQLCLGTRDPRVGRPKSSIFSRLGLRLEQVAVFYVVPWSLSKSRAPSLTHLTTLPWNSLFIKLSHMRPKYGSTLQGASSALALKVEHFPATP